MIAGFAEARPGPRTSRSTSQAARRRPTSCSSIRRPKDGRLLRTYGAAPGQAPKAAVNGYLEDYAFLVHGLLTLHDATKDKRWLDEARELTDTMIEFHGDKKARRLLLHRQRLTKSSSPAARTSTTAPSPRATAWPPATWCACGPRPATRSGRRRRTGTFRYFAGSLKSYGPGMVTLAEALDRYLEVRDAKKCTSRHSAQRRCCQFAQRPMPHSTNRGRQVVRVQALACCAAAISASSCIANRSWSLNCS